MTIYQAVEWTFYNDSHRSIHIAYFTTEEDARIVTEKASKNGIPVGEKIKAIQVHDLASWTEKETARIKAEGLKKLTVQEREALGLTEG